MLEFLLFAIALAGTAIGGWIDIKTTEIPDIVPLSMVASALAIHIAEAYFAWSLFPLYPAFAVALGYLAFGYVLYYAGQWGEADVLLLGAVGFVLPVAPAFFNPNVAGLSLGIYPLIFLLNTFIVGGVYSVSYAFAIAWRQKNIRKIFYADILANAKSFVRITLMFLAGAAVITGYVNYYLMKVPPFVFVLQAALIIPAFAALFSIWRFAIVVDREAFRKRVATGKLREGDVLAERVEAGGLKMPGKLFVGLTRADIKKIQKAKKSVLIKEGIRYGPTFFLALVATWLFGNLLMLAIG